MTVPELRTERLVLRPIVETDIDSIVEALNDEETTRPLTMVPYPYVRSDAEWFVREFLTGADAGPHWALDPGMGLVGVISIKPDMGYWLRRDLWGRGLMTEAAQAVVQHHFEGAEVQTLSSGHHLGNERSRRILRGLGFVDAEVITDTKVSTGEPVEVQRMILTRAAWKARP